MLRRLFFLTLSAVVVLTASAKEGDGVDLDPNEKLVRGDAEGGSCSKVCGASQ